MRVISMLLGIPESDQEAVRDHVDDNLRTEEGKPMEVTGNFVTGEMFADYIDWRAEHPSDDIMTELLNVEFTDETGTVRAAHPGRAPDVSRGPGRRGERDDHPPDRVDGQGAGRAPRSARRPGEGPVAGAERDRGDPALRVAGAPRRAVRRQGGPRRARHEDPGGKRDALPAGFRQPGRPALPRRRHASTSIAR